MAAGVADAQIHRCARDGKVAFSDQPCAPGDQATRLNYNAGSTAGAVALRLVTKHYDVRGTRRDALLRSLQTNGPMGYHGLAQWQIGYLFTTAVVSNGCRIDNVVVTIDGEILMPRWTDRNDAPAELQRKWTDYYGALMRHEEGHIGHGKEFAALLKQRLMGLGVVSCERIKELAQTEFQRLHQNLSSRDKEYDARTKHGVEQGVEL